MSFSRTNYRTTGANVDNGAVAQASLADAIKFAKGTKRNAVCSTTGFIKVSTGLTSPVYGVTIELASGTVANRFKKLRYLRCTGSYLCLKLHRQTWTTDNKFKEAVLPAGVTVGFVWMAFEA